MKQAGAIAAAVIALAGLTKGAWSIAEPFTGVPPWASQGVVQLLAGREEDRINIQQIQRQVEIDRLKQRCAIRCDQFDRRALQNLIEEWHREQKHLDQFRLRR